MGLIDEVDPSLLVVAILTTGARIPVMRLNAEQSASPVPLCGAGNTSGVYAYRTPYIYHVLISNDLRITLRESLRRFYQRQKESVNRVYARRKRVAHSLSQRGSTGVAEIRRVGFGCREKE